MEVSNENLPRGAEGFLGGSMPAVSDRPLNLPACASLEFQEEHEGNVYQIYYVPYGGTIAHQIVAFEIDFEHPGPQRVAACRCPTPVQKAFKQLVVDNFNSTVIGLRV